MELTSRIRAALRRRAEPEPYRLGGLAIHYEERRVSVAGRPVELTATEYELPVPPSACSRWLGIIATRAGLRPRSDGRTPCRSQTAALSAGGDSQLGRTSVAERDFHDSEEVQRLRGDQLVIKPHAVGIEAWRIRSRP